MNWPISRTVAWLTLRQLFVRRRLIAAIFFALTPLLIVVLFVSARGAAAADGRTAGLLMDLYRDVVIGVLLPLSAVVFGTAAFGGEIDDGTIVYLLVKPLSRWRVVLSKYVVAPDKIG